MDKIEQLTKREKELIEVLHKNERRFYLDGISQKPFLPLPKFTLETAPEELDRMIDEYNEKDCMERGIKFNDEEERTRYIEAVHYVFDIYIRSYLRGLKGEKPEGENDNHEG